MNSIELFCMTCGVTSKRVSGKWIVNVTSEKEHGRVVLQASADELWYACELLYKKYMNETEEKD